MPLCDALAQMGDWIVEAGPAGILVYRHGRLVAPDDLPMFLEVVDRVIHALSE
jgi:hypothetical protein